MANKMGNFRPQQKSFEGQVMVSFIENSCMLWVQDMSPEGANAIMNMSQQLEEYCSKGDKLTEYPQPNVIYATQFSEDNLWYRCVLRNTLPSDRVRVHYIDYGNFETILATQLVPLPDAITSIPKLAYKLWLQNTRVVEATRKEAQEALSQLTGDKVLNMTRLHQLADGSGYYGMLYDPECNIHIIDTMLQKGLMQTREFQNRNNEQQQLQQQRSRPPSVGSPQQKQPMTPISSTNQNRSTPSPQQPPDKFPSPAPHEFLGRPGAMVGGMMVDGKVDSQKEAVMAENSMLRAKLKSMQEEFNKLSSRTPISASNHDKIQQTCRLADKVRKCRAQFPTDKPEDLIEDTIQLLCESDAFIGQRSVPSLRHVSAKSDEYSKAQDSLVNTAGQDISSLIEDRNVRKQQLCDALEAFLNDPSLATLEERDNKVKLASMNMDRHYHEFLLFIVQKQLPIAELSPLYLEWKSKQTLNFTTLRQESSLAESAVCKALGQIKMNFSLADEQNLCSVNLDFNYDQLLKNYASCLDRELKSTDIQQSRDSLFLATVIHNVKAACNREHANIQNVLLLMTEYTQKLADLKKWEDGPPNLDELSTLRKTVLSLRSKLRHLVVDLQDLEETEDCNSGEKERVLNELSAVRKELQSHLVQEETLLRDVAQMANEHFPELYHTHPQLKLELSSSYGDVVKSGRELDYYTLQTVPNKQGVYVTHFNNESVYIKEYTISDQRAFLNNVKAYQQLSTEYLTPLQAVFFSKSNRQAYTQTAVIGQPLYDYIQTHKTSSAEREQVVRQSFECLQILHTSGFTYGQLSPQTIHWTGSALTVDEMDLSGQPRHSDTWFTCSNLVFRAPEVLAGQPLNKQSDLYCLGLTILWLHFPDVTFPLKHDGSPDLNQIHMDPPVRQLLDILIARIQHWSLPEILTRYYQYMNLCQKYSDEHARVASPAMPNLRGQSPSAQVMSAQHNHLDESRDSISPASASSLPNCVSDATISEVDTDSVLRSENSIGHFDEIAHLAQMKLDGINQAMSGDMVGNDVFYDQIPPHAVIMDLSSDTS